MILGNRLFWGQNIQKIKTAIRFSTIIIMTILLEYLNSFDFIIVFDTGVAIPLMLSKAAACIWVCTHACAIYISMYACTIYIHIV